MCVCIKGHTCYGVYVEVRGQHCGVDSLPPLSQVFQGLNLGHLWTTEPSHWPVIDFCILT